MALTHANYMSDEDYIELPLNLDAECNLDTLVILLFVDDQGILVVCVYS